MFLSRQFTWWNILYSFPVILFLNVDVDLICLQHLYARLDLQGVHFPTLFRLRFTTRFFSILFPPRSCCRLGFLLYAINGSLVNFFAISLLIDIYKHLILLLGIQEFQKSVQNMINTYIVGSFGFVLSE